MKLCLASLLVVCCTSYSQSQTQLGISGLQRAHTAEIRAEKSIPQPVLATTHVTAKELSRKAAELEKLARSIGPDLEQKTKRVPAKDLNKKLKKIEHLARDLQSDLVSKKATNRKAGGLSIEMQR